MVDNDVYFGTSPLNVMDTLNLTITLDDGTEAECEVMGIFAVKEIEYIAMYPIAKNDDNKVYLFRFTEGEDDQVELANIESDTEYEAATAAFQEMIGA